MVCTRVANTNCKLLNKLVFADANFFINIIDTIGMPLLDNNHDPWNHRLNNFKTTFTQVLQDCATCTPNDRISTTELVGNEINPLNANSAIRRESTFFSRVGGECTTPIYNQFFNEINQIMGNHTSPVRTEPEQRDQIRDTLLAAPTSEIRNLCQNQTPNEGLSPSDLSLITAAITESNARGTTLIVTDDEDLRKAVEYLYQLRAVTIQGSGQSTRNLFHWGISMYTSSFHKCCLFSNEFELRILENVTTNDLIRPMADKKRKLKSIHVHEAFELMIETMRTKAGVTS